MLWENGEEETQNPLLTRQRVECNAEVADYRGCMTMAAPDPVRPHRILLMLAYSGPVRDDFSVMQGHSCMESIIASLKHSGVWLKIIRILTITLAPYLMSGSFFSAFRAHHFNLSSEIYF